MNLKEELESIKVEFAKVCPDEKVRNIIWRMFVALYAIRHNKKSEKAQQNFEKWIDEVCIWSGYQDLTQIETAGRRRGRLRLKDKHFLLKWDDNGKLWSYGKLALIMARFLHYIYNAKSAVISEEGNDGELYYFTNVADKYYDACEQAYEETKEQACKTAVELWAWYGGVRFYQSIEDNS